MGENKSKYTCELYITNCSYSNKVGIVLAMYQRMRSKGTSWAGPRLSVFIFFMVVWLLPFCWLIKRLVSKVDTWIRWEYPTIKRGGEGSSRCSMRLRIYLRFFSWVRRMLYATEDILTLFFLREWIFAQRNTHRWEFHRRTLIYFLYIQHSVIRFTSFASIISTRAQNCAHLSYARHDCVKVKGGPSNRR